MSADDSNLLQRTARHGALYALAAIGARAISVVMLPLYTRYLTAAEYGIVDFAFVLGALVKLTVGLEITQAVARFFPDAKDAAEKIAIASGALWFTLLCYAAFLAIAAALAGPLGLWVFEAPGRETDLLIVALSMVATGVLYCTQSQLRWMLQPRDYTVSNLLFAGGTAATTALLLVGFGLGVRAVFLGQLAGGVIGTVYALWAGRSAYGRTWRWSEVRRMLAFAAPLVLSSTAVFVATSIDRVLIKELLSLKELGIYGVGYRVASVVGLLILSVQGALTPLVMNQHRESGTPAQIARVFDVVAAGGLVAVLGLWLFGGLALAILAPGPYASAHALLPVLAAAQLLGGLYVFAPGLLIAKRTGLIAAISVLSAVTNTLCSWWWITVGGSMGAAAATAAASAIAFLAYVVLGGREYAVPFRWRVLLPCTGAVCAMGAVAWWLAPPDAEGAVAWTIRAALLAAGAIGVWPLLRRRTG